MTRSSHPRGVRALWIGGRHRCLGGVVVLLAVALLPRPAHGRAVIEKTFEVPAPGVTHIVIEHPLGALTVRGWSRPTVLMKAVKRGPDEATARRLRVKGNMMPNGRVHIETRVIRAGALPVGQKLLERSEHLKRELKRLLHKPKPWSPEVRAQYRKLTEELYKVLRETFELSGGSAVGRGREAPLKGADLALTVYVPRGVTLEAHTLRGDIDAADLRGGVTLRSRHGRIFARNLAGGVRTRSDQGRQFISTVRGPVDVDGLDGDLQMRRVRGAHVKARLARGAIVAREIEAPLMRFSTTQGGVTVTATLLGDGRLEVRTLRGAIDVRLDAAGGYRFRGRTEQGQLWLPPGARVAPGSPEARQGRVGAGRGLVTLRAHHGDVRLR